MAKAASPSFRKTDGAAGGGADGRDGREPGLWAMSQLGPRPPQLSGAADGRGMQHSQASQGSAGVGARAGGRTRVRGARPEPSAWQGLRPLGVCTASMLGNTGSSGGRAGAVEGGRAAVGRPAGTGDPEMVFSSCVLRSADSSGSVRPTATANAGYRSSSPDTLTRQALEL